MRVLLVSDVPGVSGIDRATACLPGTPDYSAGLAARQAELHALTAILHDLGANKVAVLDWHAWHPGSTPLTRHTLPPGIAFLENTIDQGFDVAIVHGFHAMTGAPGFCSHTFVPNLIVKANGQPVGELALLTWWLGEHGIPIGLVAGDRGLSQEAERWAEQTTTVTVKRGITWDTALVLSAEEAYTALRVALTRVLARREFWWVYRPPNPLALSMEYNGTPLGQRETVSSVQSWLTISRRRLGEVVR